MYFKAFNSERFECQKTKMRAHIDIFHVFFLRIIFLIFVIAFNSVDFSNEIIFAHCARCVALR